MSGARPALRVALVCGLLAGCVGGHGSLPTPSLPAREISLIVGSADDLYVRALVAGATDQADLSGVPLRVFETTDRVEQRARLFEGIERPDRAVIIAPVDYFDIYLLLRTAHDRAVPAFVLDLDPPPANNEAYVWCFLSTGRVRAAEAGARALARRLPHAAHSVVVVSSEEAGLGPSLAAQARLRALLPGVRVRLTAVRTGKGDSVVGLRAVVDDADGVLVTDERAAQALLDAPASGNGPPRVPFVAVGATEEERQALRSGLISALVAPRPGELGRRAVQYAVAAAASQPELIPRSVRLDLAVLTRSDLGSAKELSVAYPAEVPGVPVQGKN
jgi:ABC-type sugar transport system substrate-binding protein